MPEIDIFIYQILMSAHWALTPVHKLALIHVVPIPAAVSQVMPWMLMDILAMVYSLISS